MDTLFLFVCGFFGYLAADLVAAWHWAHAEREPYAVVTWFCFEPKFAFSMYRFYQGVEANFFWVVGCAIVMPLALLGVPVWVCGLVGGVLARICVGLVMSKRADEFTKKQRSRDMP